MADRRAPKPPPPQALPPLAAACPVCGEPTPYTGTFPAGAGPTHPKCRDRQRDVRLMRDVAAAWKSNKRANGGEEITLRLYNALDRLVESVDLHHRTEPAPPAPDGEGPMI